MPKKTSDTPAEEPPQVLTTVPQTELRSVVNIVESATGDRLWSSQFLPMPEFEGRQLAINVYIEGQVTQHLYYIDRLVAETNTVFVTLNKVYIDGTPISVP